MRRIKWLVTIVGTPLAFPGCGPAKQGKTVEVDDETAARAIEAGMAQEIKPEPPANKKER